MFDNILDIKGIVFLKKDHQRIINGGAGRCQNIARKCLDDSDCCSGMCGVEKIINGRPIVISVCAF